MSRFARLVAEADDLKARLVASSGDEKERIAADLAAVAMRIERERGAMGARRELKEAMARLERGDSSVEDRCFGLLSSLGRWCELVALAEAAIMRMEAGGPAAWNALRARRLCRLHNEALVRSRER